ncbi:senescence/dehydration-associated protein At4g35985, chloroplastic [Dendrobium catenatum]|uniref:Senescence domain-containing protein n=1 Tax=Dendrobium catenatum TaxID=906689 RepID=A0A2I0WE37_9ASPA|nr:senescence/dehydration-associated protein At4g35985, chloroplastic [Dendrobium catenatum]PKU73920.1 hypothetical protein MA16_Dca024547 [Dendrobium catenatum]
MGCCGQNNIRTSSPPPPNPTKLKSEFILQIPNAKVTLAGDPEAAIELSQGDLSVFHLTEDSVPLATVIKVGNLSWPLTKDEPVVRLDKLHYLFTIPDEEAGFFNYGVSFTAAAENHLASFDQFLKENSCFSPITTTSPAAKINDLYWKDYAPNIEDYNGVLAKAIARGTGEIVKGIFKLSNEYSNQVQKGASLIKPQTGERKNNNGASVDGSRKPGGINNTLKRARKLSMMTEKLSQTLLNGVLAMTGNVAAPLVQSKAGKSLFATVPGEVLLASLDALSKVLDAAEFAEKRAFAATSGAVTQAVSKRLGESAGETTDDVLATAGHAIGTAWNVFKIRKAINPKASVTSNIINNAARKKSK